MSRLDPAKLHVRFEAGVAPEGPAVPRRYTLTHSDTTGELFFTIGADYDRAQNTGWYAHLMHDEVLAEWLPNENGPALHLYCHVSGGGAFGGAALRDAIFHQELPRVLEAFRYGDAGLFTAHPELDQAPIYIHFHSHRARYDRVEEWGTPAQYRV